MSEVEMTTSKPLVIDCRQVTRTYDQGPETLTIFSDISLEVSAGETVAIVGSSGAGKTTLLNLLGGLDRPSSGQIHICGEDIHRLSEAGRARFRNGHLGFVYQFHQCPNLPMSCGWRRSDSSQLSFMCMSISRGLPIAKVRKASA